MDVVDGDSVVDSVVDVGVVDVDRALDATPLDEAVFPLLDCSW